MARPAQGQTAGTARTPRSISAADLLRGYDHLSLQQMARKRGIDVKNKSKSMLVSLVARTLYSPGAIAAALEDLEPVEREALDQLILAGGESSTAALRQQLQAEGKIDPPARRTSYGSYQDSRGSPGVRGSPKFEDIVARLGALGLVFTVGFSTHNKNLALAVPGDYLFIPQGVMEHLPPVTQSVETAPAPEVQTEPDPAVLLRDVYALLTFARDQPIPLTVRGLMPKRTLVQIDSALRLPEGAAQARSEADLGRLPFLRALAEELELLLAGAGSLRLGDEVSGFLARPAGERRRALFDAYRKTQRWSELTRIPGLSVWPRENAAGPGVVGARERVLAEIAELPVGEWIPIGHLLARISRRAFEFLLPRSWQRARYYGYSSSYEPTPYLGDNPLGLTFESTSGEAVGWETVEGGFIRSAVTEALHWLGAVDLGSAPGEAASAFRVREEGAVLLRGGTPSAPEPEPRVVIQPNFQIFAFDPTGEDVLFTLDQIAERVRAEQVVEYRLTRESVYAAQRRGIEVPEILAFLDRVSAAPPQNVRRSLEEWGAQHDRVVVRRGSSLLHTLDEAALDALYADPALSRLLGRRVAPAAALVPADRLDEVYRHLLEGGHPIPALSEGNDAFPHPALRVDPSGRITFRQRLPSMYVRRALQPFAEEEADGSFEITARSLRRAARGSGAQRVPYPPLTAEDVIATLERYHLGPLPEETAAMVRRWVKDWGRGSLAEVTLLQVESAEILDDLLADPELKPYLAPLPGAPGMATVQREAVEQVRELLQARGMELEDQPGAPKKRRSRGR